MWIIRLLLTGLLAGFLGGKLMMKHSTLSLSTALIIGIIGSMIGHFLFMLLGLRSVSWIGEILVSIIGTCAFLYGLSYFSKK